MTAPAVPVGLVGGGVVADRLRRITQERYRLVGPDVEAPVVVLAVRRLPRRCGRRPGPPRGPRRVHIRLGRRRARPARPRRRRPARRGDRRRRRGGVAGAERLARPPPRRSSGRRRRAARRRARHRRPGVCPRTPPLAAWLGRRLAGREVDRAPGRERSRAVLVPRARRRPRLLPGRDAGPVAAAPQRSTASTGSAPRMSATRRDRFTARLPMLSPPHREGGIGRSASRRAATTTTAGAPPTSSGSPS